MTSPPAGDGEALLRRRKQLKFRSWHRGTKELDLLFGPFADACLDEFDGALLEQYAELLVQPDPDVYDWIMGRLEPPAPARSEALARIVAFHRRGPR